MKPLRVLDASCKDCHRCLRECPVKAISFEDDQAQIIEEKCIYCGTCIEVCPQEAKVPRNELSLFEEFLSGDSSVAISLAPSFVTYFKLDSPYKLVGALKKIGTDYVTETSTAAHLIAKTYNKLVSDSCKPLVSSCCPVVVNLIEKHFPELIPYLAPVLSPMTQHASILRSIYGDDTKVIFIGPCVAKMDEMDQNKKGVDIVITFDQLSEYFHQNEINIFQSEEKLFDQGCLSRASSYPIESGAVKSAFLYDKRNENRIFTASGMEECINVLEDLKHGRISPYFVELMACNGGCINGPSIENDLSIARRRQIVQQYYNKKKSHSHCLLDENDLEKYLPLDLKREYVNRKPDFPIPSEEEIQEILNSIGKYSEEDESNCGGCGYDTCREKAVAVYQGLAKRKMCIPYMKSRAESLSDIIVESSHNAIIVVDREMIIQEFNPVACQMFTSADREKPINQPLSRYIDPSLFKKAWENKCSIKHKKVKYDRYDLVTDQTIFPLEEYEVIVGIFTDATEQERQKQELKEMKRMAADRAADVVHKQMAIVQEIAGLLGETTVETKAALYELTELIQEDE